MKQIILILCLVFFSNYSSSQMNISDEELQRYLKEFGVTSDDFNSDEEMALYFVENVEKISGFYYLANVIARIPNKSSELLDAIHEKILQCLIAKNKGNASPYTGVLLGFIQNSPTAYSDYILFFENLLSENSRYNNEEYLLEIALHPPREESKLFSLEDRIRILSAKILLMFDAKHPMATRYFMEYPIEVRKEPVGDCFIFKENEWSGSGIIGSDGKWILPPFYEFYSGSSNCLSDGWINFMIVNDSYNNDQRPEGTTLSWALGSWVNKQGQLMTKNFVSSTSAFESGVARYGRNGDFQYIDTNGKVDKERSVSTFKILSGGYELKNNEEETLILNSQKEMIATLPKKYGYVQVLEQDGLIGYADIPGYPGEGLAGFMDLEGNILVEPSFLISSDDHYDFPGFKGFDVMVVRGKSRYAGLVDRSFKEIIPIEYDQMWIKNSKYVLAEKQGELILFNTKGERVNQPAAEKFDNQHDNCLGEYCFTTDGHSMRIADLEGEIVSGFENIGVKGRFENIFICAKGNKLGAFDQNLNEVLPFNYNKAYAMPGNKIMYSGLNGFQCKWLDEEKVYDLPEGFYPDALTNQYTYYLGGEFIPGRMGSKTGVVNTKGEIVIPFDHYLLSLSHIPEK